jgi:hypothetical protein
MADWIVNTIIFLLTLGSIGFGIYKFVQGDVTNGLLSFILAMVSLNVLIHTVEKTP